MTIAVDLGREATKQTKIKWTKTLVVNIFTVLPAKSNSDIMFVQKEIRDLKFVDDLCINPIRRIVLMHK